MGEAVPGSSVDWTEYVEDTDRLVDLWGDTLYHAENWLETADQYGNGDAEYGTDDDIVHETYTNLEISEALYAGALSCIPELRELEDQIASSRGKQLTDYDSLPDTTDEIDSLQRDLNDVMRQMKTQEERHHDTLIEAQAQFGWDYMDEYNVGNFTREALQETIQQESNPAPEPAYLNRENLRKAAKYTMLAAGAKIILDTEVEARVEQELERREQESTGILDRYVGKFS